MARKEALPQHPLGRGSLWALRANANGPATAIITGASSGIGAAFARRLAAFGFDLLLIARRQDRLNTLAAELQDRHAITAEVLVADLSRLGDVERVERQIAALDSVGILVNAAGFGTVGDFAAVDLVKHLAMIDVHVVASVRLSYAALPAMLARGQGAIVNVSSIGAFLAGPAGRGNVTYCATKAYLLAFSQALFEEVREAGIRVQALCPGFTYTAFHDTPEYAAFDRSQVPAVLWMSADDVVTASLRALARNQAVCIPGARSQLLVALGRNGLTASLVRRTTKRIAKELSPHAGVVQRSPTHG